MTGAGMIGTSVMTGVAMDTAMTIVGAMIAASVTPTGDGMIATFGMATDAEMSAITGTMIDVGMIGASGMTIGADKSQPPYSANVGAAAAGAISLPQ